MLCSLGTRGGVVVTALLYKPGGGGSIPDGVIGIFQWHNPSGLTMTLGSTQPLTEMSTMCIFGGKAGRCVRLTTLPPSCAVVMKSGNLKFLEQSGPLQACNGAALPLLIICASRKWLNSWLCIILPRHFLFAGSNISKVTSYFHVVSFSFRK